MKPDNVVIDLTKETIDKRKMSSEVNSELTNVTKKIKKYKTWTGEYLVITRDDCGMY